MCPEKPSLKTGLRALRVTPAVKFFFCSTNAHNSYKIVKLLK